MTGRSNTPRSNRVYASATLLCCILVLGALVSWFAQDDPVVPVKFECNSHASPMFTSARRDSSGKDTVVDASRNPPRQERQDAPSPTLVAVVLDQHDTPLESASVVLVRSDGKREERETDVAGRVGFAHPGQGYLVARAHGHVPIIRSVLPDQRVYALRYDTGIRIEGKLLIDDAPPGHPLELSATIENSGFISRYHRTLASSPSETVPLPIRIRTDETGAYRVEGLDTGWKVVFTLPAGLRMSSDDPDKGRTVRHTGPLRGDLTLDLRTTRRTKLTGRCVDLSGNVLPGVPIELRISLKHASGRISKPTVWGSSATGTDGRFMLYLDVPPGAERIRVVARRLGMELSQAIPLDGPKKQELSDFVFPVSRDICVRIIDEGSRPIVGAIVGTPDALLLQASDTNGQVRFPMVSGGRLALHVAAKGFRFLKTLVESDSPHFQTVRMRRANLTVFSLEHADGTPAGGQGMRIAFHAPPFRNRDALCSPVMQALWPDLSFWEARGEHCIAGPTDSSGKLEVYDIVPNRIARITVQGFEGVVLASSTTRVSGLDGQRIRVTVGPDRAVTVRGQVIDGEGRALRDAVVILGQSRSSGGNIRYTDEDGFFQYDAVAFEGAYIRVGKVGFRKVTRFIENIRDLDGALEFRLQPAARCRLVVKEADGRMMKKAHVELPWVHDPGMGPVVLKKGPGTFEIVDIGNEPCHPVIYGPGGTKRKITIHPDVDTLKIVRFE